MPTRPGKRLSTRSLHLQKRLERCNEAIHRVWGADALGAIPEPCRPPTKNDLSSWVVRGLRRLAALQTSLAVARVELLAARDTRLGNSGRSVAGSKWLTARDVETVIERYERQGSSINTITREGPQSPAATTDPVSKSARVLTPNDVVKIATRSPPFPAFGRVDREDHLRPALAVRDGASPLKRQTTLTGDGHDIYSPSHAITPQSTSTIQRLRIIQSSSSSKAASLQKRRQSQADPSESSTSQRQKKHRPNETPTFDYCTRSKLRKTDMLSHDRESSPARILQSELVGIIDFGRFQWPVRLQHPTESGTWYLINSGRELLHHVQAAHQKRMLLLETQSSDSQPSAPTAEPPQDDEPPSLETEAAMESVRSTQVAGLLNELEETWARKLLFVHDALLSDRQDVEDDQAQALQDFLGTFKTDLAAARQKFEHDCCAVGLLCTINGPQPEVAERRDSGLGLDEEAASQDLGAESVGAAQVTRVIDLFSDSDDEAIAQDLNKGREKRVVIDLCSSDSDDK